MKKKLIKRTLSGIALSLTVAIAGIITLILKPEITYANKMEYGQFDIYSNQSIEEEIKTYLDLATEIVKKSELYDADYKYDIFLSHESTFNEFDSFIFGEWAAARTIHNNIIVKIPIQIEDGIAIQGDNTFALEYIFAHEMIHCLQQNTFGMLNYNPIKHPPLWIQEGYPEYVSRQPLLQSESYNLISEISNFLSKTGDKHYPLEIIKASETTNIPYVYYKGRLMTEYLIEVKKQSYKEIWYEERSEEAVWKELINWHKQTLTNQSR